MCCLLSACTSNTITGDRLTSPEPEIVSAISLDDPDFMASPEALIDLGQHEPLLNTRAPGNRANGKYLTIGGHRVIFQANENNAGVQGRGQITGPYYVDLQFRTVCIEVVGNRATYAGEVTRVELSDPDPEVPIVPGSIIYLAVEDNSKESKASPDRYHEEVYVAPPGVIQCQLLTPINPFIWYESGWFEAAGKGDQIQVK